MIIVNILVELIVSFTPLVLPSPTSLEAFYVHVFHTSRLMHRDEDFAFCGQVLLITVM